MKMKQKNWRMKKASNKRNVERGKTEREFLKCKKKLAQEKKSFACFGARSLIFFCGTGTISFSVLRAISGQWHDAFQPCNYLRLRRRLHGAGKNLNALIVGISSLAFHHACLADSLWPISPRLNKVPSLIAEKEMPNTVSILLRAVQISFSHSISGSLLECFLRRVFFGWWGPIKRFRAEEM